MTAKYTGHVGWECFVLLIWKPVLEMELEICRLPVVMYNKEQKFEQSVNEGVCLQTCSGVCPFLYSSSCACRLQKL